MTGCTITSRFANSCKDVVSCTSCCSLCLLLCLSTFSSSPFLLRFDITIVGAVIRIVSRQIVALYRLLPGMLSRCGSSRRSSYLMRWIQRIDIQSGVVSDSVLITFPMSPSTGHVERGIIRRLRVQLRRRKRGGILFFLRFDRLLVVRVVIRIIGIIEVGFIFARATSVGVPFSLFLILLEKEPASAKSYKDSDP